MFRMSLGGRSALLGLIAALSAHGVTHAAEHGMVRKRSPHSVEQTLDRLEQVLRAKGLRVFARIKHQANAKQAGMKLRPTEVLIFGNPKLGTQLMTAEQSAGIDLPMKALAWRDAAGQVWLAYNDPAYLARRHGIDQREAVVRQMQEALHKLTAAALSKQRRADRRRSRPK